MWGTWCRTFCVLCWSCLILRTSTCLDRLRGGEHGLSTWWALLYTSLSISDAYQGRVCAHDISRRIRRPPARYRDSFGKTAVSTQASLDVVMTGAIIVMIILTSWNCWWAVGHREQPSATYLAGAGVPILPQGIYSARTLEYLPRICTYSANLSQLRLFFWLCTACGV